MDIGAVFDIPAEASPELFRALEHGIPLLARLYALFSDLEQAGSGQPDSELPLVALENPSVVPDLLYPQLTTFAAIAPVTEFLPQSRVYEVRREKARTHYYLTAVRYPGFRLVSDARVLLDCEEAVTDYDAPLLVAWLAMLPGPDGFRETSPGKFRAFGYMRDSDGHEGAFLSSGAHPVIWLPLQGKELHELVALIELLTNRGTVEKLRNRMLACAPSAVARLAATTFSGELSARLQDDPQYLSALDKVLHTACMHLGFEGAMFLQTLSTQMQEAHAQVQAQVAKETNRLQQAFKRKEAEQRQLKNAYAGMRDRANRQDAQIQQLRKELRTRPAAQQEATSDLSLTQALTALF